MSHYVACTCWCIQEAYSNVHEYLVRIFAAEQGVSSSVAISSSVSFICPGVLSSFCLVLYVTAVTSIGATRLQIRPTEVSILT